MYQNFLNREVLSMFLGQLMSLNVKWINHPFYSHLANYKIVQLEKAKNIGFSLPDTCISTDPEILFNFYNKKVKSNLDVITKAIYSGYVQSKNSDEDEILFTQKVDIDSVSQIPKNNPLLFQEKINVDYEIRCFVIGDRVLSAKIWSEQDYCDCREINGANLKAEPLVLPEIQQHLCIKLANIFNLNYGAIDLMFKDKKYFFLDFNPNGEWMWYENNADLPISESIVDLINQLNI